MTRYEQGFITKCAEYGVDTRTAIEILKSASESRDPVSSGVVNGAGLGFTLGSGLGALTGGAFGVQHANDLIKSPASGTRGMNARTANKFVKEILEASKTLPGRIKLRASRAVVPAAILASLLGLAGGTAGTAAGGLVGLTRKMGDK